LTYYYYLTHVDPHGYSNVNVEPVSAVPENLPPLAPSGLRVTTAMRDATIEWIRNPEPDVIRYHLYRSMGSTGDMENGVPIAQADADDTTYTDPGLDAGTAYFYYLTAEDDSGQLSNRSKQVSISIRRKPHADRSLIYFIFPAGYALLLFLRMPF
jgi:TolB protein